MNRRTFAGIFALSCISAIAPSCTVTAEDSSGMNQKQHILIVGAGIAGLAAAQILIEQGHQVLILEGRERTGGRIWTSRQWPDVPLDLGATWIHGSEGNPIMALAQKVGARTATTDYDNSIIYYTNGKPLSDRQESRLETLEEVVFDLLEAAQEGDQDLSIQTVLERSSPWQKFSVEDKKLVQFLLNSYLEQEYGGSLSELSVYWYDDDGEFDGDEVLFLDGYQSIINHLAQNVPISLGEAVKQVQWDDRQVTLTTTKKTYTADRAIITLPLGVLKAGTVTFSPSLPESKRQAIAALGMGVLNKCYLRFPKTFWPSELDWLEYISASPGEWTEWVSCQRFTQRPILLGFNAAQVGRNLESWTDAKIIDSAMATLKTIFGTTIPAPEDYQITRWATDPFALGSYSFNAIASTPKMRDHLAEPIRNRLFFAGEATHRQYFGTVHGAYLSGVRAAKQILASAP